MRAPADELEHRVALLHALDLFAPLPRRRVERLAAAVVRLRFPAGAVVVRQGDEGDYFYVVGEGEVEVTRSGRTLAVRRAGEYFGEIALLRRAPRTATVVARTAASLYALETCEFVAAISSTARSAELAELCVQARSAG